MILPIKQKLKIAIQAEFVSRGTQKLTDCQDFFSKLINSTDHILTF